MGGGTSLRPHATVKSMASPAQSHVPPRGTIDMSDINLSLEEDCAERVQSYTHGACGERPTPPKGA